MVKLSVLCHRANAHADEVWSLAWSRGASDARARLVTGSLDESVKRWGGDDDGDALDDLRDAHAYTGHALGVCALDANARGMVAASALDGVVRAWDAETGETLAAIEGAPGESWGVKFDPSDASTLLAIGGGDVAERARARRERWDAEADAGAAGDDGGEAAKRTLRPERGVLAGWETDRVRSDGRHGGGVRRENG